MRGGEDVEQEMIVRRYGRERVLATKIVKFLKQEDVTYKEAIEALEDARSFLERASREHKL